MSIDSVSSSIPLAPEPELFPATGKQELEKADFLKLFVTQLQYQDPMKPMDTYEMSSQLAQFSSMEATMRMADNMEELLSYQVSQNNLQLLQLLDSTVRAGGNMVAVNEGQTSATEFTLGEGAVSAVVEIYDQTNSLVRTIELNNFASGTYELDWDAENMAGDVVPDEPYFYNVKAMDLNGQQVDVDYRMTGLVTGIEFETGKALLTIDNYINISVSDVLEVL